MKTNRRNQNVKAKCDSLELPADRFIISQAKQLDCPFCADDVKGDYDTFLGAEAALYLKL